MMNILQVQDTLKGMPMEQLIREMQMPSGQAPQFLVLGEITRRKKMEQEAQQQAPTTTVAQDAVTAAGVPQGGIADIARSMAPKTDVAQNTGIAQSMPQMPSEPQRMAYGGYVQRMAPGGPVVRGGMQMAPEYPLEGTEADQAAWIAQYGATHNYTGEPKASQAMEAIQSQFDQPEDVRTLDLLGYERFLEPRLDAADDAMQRFQEDFGTEVPPGAFATSLDRVLGRGTATQEDMASPFDEFSGIADMFAGPVDDMSPQLSREPSPYTSGVDVAAQFESEALGGDEVRAARRAARMDRRGQGDRYLAERDARLRLNQMYDEMGMGEIPGLGLPTESVMQPLDPAGDIPGLGLPLESAMELTGEVYEPYSQNYLQRMRNMGPQPGPLPTPSPLPEEIPDLSAYQDIPGTGLPLVTPPTATSVPAALPMDTGTPLSIPDAGIESLMPPAAKKQLDGESGGGAGGAGMSALDQEIMDMLQRREKAAEQDKWLALAQAGMALMSSKQPTFGGALGEAGLAGIETLRSGRDKYEEDRLALLTTQEKLRVARAAAAAKTAPKTNKEAIEFYSKYADSLDRRADELAKLVALGQATPEDLKNLRMQALAQRGIAQKYLNQTPVNLSD